MIGRGFWQKRYFSKHTGREIDAAVGAAQQLPIVTTEDAGKVLLVSEEGSIIPGDQKLYLHRIKAGIPTVTSHTFYFSMITRSPDALIDKVRVINELRRIFYPHNSYAISNTVAVVGGDNLALILNLEIISAPSKSKLNCIGDYVRITSGTDGGVAVERCNITGDNNLAIYEDVVSEIK